LLMDACEATNSVTPIPYLFEVQLQSVEWHSHLT
jgi:hypothetical protein